MAYALIPIGNSYSCLRNGDLTFTTDFQVDPVIPGDTYEWFIDGVLQPGETNSIFTTPYDVQGLAQVGVYKCRVTHLGIPQDSEEKEVLPGIQVGPIEIETEDPEIPLGVCTVNPTPVVLRLKNSSVPGQSYLWSSSEPDVTQIAPDYPDVFNLTTTASDNSCSKTSNSISLDLHDNDVDPSADDGGDNTLLTGQSRTITSDRQVSWYRSDGNNVFRTFVGRGTVLTITRGGYYWAKDACGHWSSVLFIQEIGGFRLNWKIECAKSGQYRLQVEDQREDSPQFRTIAFLAMKDTSILRHGEGIRIINPKAGFDLVVSLKVNRQGWMDIWNGNIGVDAALQNIENQLKTNI